MIVFDILIRAALVAAFAVLVYRAGLQTGIEKGRKLCAHKHYFSYDHGGTSGAWGTPNDPADARAEGAASHPCGHFDGCLGPDVAANRGGCRMSTWSDVG